ncbi:MAG: IPT/TIG domain-containing protein [Acidimicrobiales bacterium]
MNNPRRIQRHLVKALAAGALLAAAALPMAIASVAGAVGVPVLTSFAFTPHGATANSIGAGSSGTVAITGSNFADNGATNDTLTATCTGASVTFTAGDVVETSSTTATADYTSTGTTAGTCSVVLVDANGTSASLAGAITVDAAPTISAVSPNSVWEATAPTTVTITGSGFATGATVSFANSVDGTGLTSSVTSISATSIVLSVTPTNPSGGAAATPGTFVITVTNTDGGSVASTGGTDFTIGNGLENVSPSATSAAATVPVALLGSGFEYGATVSLTSSDNAACFTEITNTATETVNGVTVTHALATSAITSPTAGTASIVVTSVATPEACGLTVTNGTGAGNNTNVFNLAGAFGVGIASTVAPVITSVSPTTPLTVGAAAVTETLTGSGFSSYSILGTNPTDVTYSAGNGAAGTTFTFTAAATTGVTAGAFPITVTTAAGAPTTYTPAITVAGPAIASQAPNLVVGAPIGTAIVLTGTGFTNTTSGTASGAGLSGTVSYASATTLNLVLTASPTGTTGGVVNVSTVTGTGTVASAPFSLTIDAAPLVTGPVTYKAGTDVGVGATAQTVYIHGSGFLTGATVTKFVNGAAVADPDVTATVTAVTSTQITATIAVTAGDLNTAVGYTVTNTDGGTAAVAAFAYPIFIGAGPTITSVTPTSGKAGTTTSFAVAGTNFETGATVTLSPANGTCTAPTITATTTLASTCTLGQPSSAATYLVVTNPDGGSATSTTAVLPAATTAAAFHVSGVHGAAVVGKTVTITISGTGFYGQPKITSTAVGSKFGVSKDTGRLLTVRATIKAGTKAGEHTLTVKLADGKSGKAGFDIKK